MTNNDSDSAHVADASTSLEDAENEAARAASYAEAARARAMRLRRLEAAAGGQPETTDTDAKDDDTTAAIDGTGEAESPRTRWRRLRPRQLRRPGRNALGVGVATVLISASLAASGYVVWQHHTLVRERQRSGEFAAAARQTIVTLMSIDPDHAKDDFQRMIDDTTGQLKSQLQVSAVSLVQEAHDAKVVTKVTVDDVAVQSMTDNSAVVLVAATSTTTNPDKTTRPPGRWRLSVNIEGESGQLKMSKITFLQ